jgi:hypothetical protein
VEKRPAAPPAAQAHEPSAAGETRIRRAAMAGSWYPAEKEQLATLVDGLLAGARPPKVEGNIMALISPHAGYPFSGKAAATGYELLRGKDVRRVVILALSHHLPFPGASIPDVTHFETPLGLVPVDTTAVARLRRCSVVTTVPEAELREHSLEIQLPLLQRVLPRFSLVPLLVSRMSEKDYPDLAAALGEVVDAHTVVVASSDFTHRGASYSYEVPEGPGTLKERLARLDQGSVDQVLKLSRAGLLAHADQTGTTICGLHPIGVLLELLSRYRGVKGQVVSRYTSGDVTGDWESTVTYVDVVFTGAWPVRSPLDEARSAGEKVFPLSARDKMTLLRLARASLEASVRRGRFDRDAIRSIPPTASLQRRAGAFVTLKCKHGPEAVCIGKGEDLRGCIGTILPQEAVYDTVAQRAASAALEDSRFPHPVAVQELEHVTVEVSVLTPPRPVRGAGEIVVGRHGIILSKEGRSATFLPQVAPEQGWDRETTLRHLAAKAGLPAGSWTEASFQVYEAIVFSEADHLFP